jgi:hypothetical protein
MHRLDQRQLAALRHLCHSAKHIGHALPPPALCIARVFYGSIHAAESVFCQPEHLAFIKVADLNKAGLCALDLTYLNSDSYIWIRHRFGRSFTKDEAASCPQLSGASDLRRYSVLRALFARLARDDSSRTSSLRSWTGLPAGGCRFRNFSL